MNINYLFAAYNHKIYMIQNSDFLTLLEDQKILISDRLKAPCS